jgi:hypothetical protein
MPQFFMAQSWHGSHACSSLAPVIASHVARLSALLLMLLPGVGHAMDMRVEGQTAYLTGGVVNSDCDSFDKLLAGSGITTVVFEKSPGGALAAGYCVGNRIRTHRLSTVIDDYCDSACSLMWLGGVERTLARKTSRLGMHGAGNDVGASDGSRGGELYQYTVGMAPNVDRKLLDEWVHFKGLSMIMLFTNDRAETCRGRGIACTPISGRNAVNVGLATK